MTVAVGFSPRSSTGPGVRRGATLEGCKTSMHSFNRRSATTLLAASDRGLKPTATVRASLREDRAEANQDPLKTARSLPTRVKHLRRCGLPFRGVAAIRWLFLGLLRFVQRLCNQIPGFLLGLPADCPDFRQRQEHGGESKKETHQPINQE